MPHCDSCKKKSCHDFDFTDTPQDCPRQGRITDYNEEELKIFQTAARVEAEGYCKWPRLLETARFAQFMGYKKLGVAFCIGLEKEAAVVCRLLRKQNLEVESCCCKCGAVEKNLYQIPDEHKLHPGNPEAACNPARQAELLEEAGCQMLVAVGLCVGHDSLFFRHATVPVTVMGVKDRVLANNPLGAVYCADGYLKELLEQKLS